MWPVIFPTPATGHPVTMWDRPELVHVHAYAKAHRRNPFGVLSVVLARATATVEPHVSLPGGGQVGLFVALAGNPGTGKDQTIATGRKAVTFTRGGAGIDIDEFLLGSGEGIARTFKGREGNEARTRALFVANEIDTFDALAGRKGSTLSPQLKQMFNGQPLGFNNASAETNSVVPEGTYTAS